MTTWPVPGARITGLAQALPETLRTWLAEPSHQGEVSIQCGHPSTLGVRLVFGTAAEHDAFCREQIEKNAAARMVQAGQMIRQQFAVMPFYWIRLRFDVSTPVPRLNALAQNFIVSPDMEWPITTLRVFLRRHGQCTDVQRLEAALLPVRSEPSSQFGLTWSVPHIPENDSAYPLAHRGRIYARVPRAALPALLAAAQSTECLSSQACAVYAAFAERFEDPGGCAFVSFAAPPLQLICVDLDRICAADLPLGFDGACVDVPPFGEFSYLKIRLMESGEMRWTGYCPWSRFALWCELQDLSKR